MLSIFRRKQKEHQTLSEAVSSEGVLCVAKHEVSPETIRKVLYVIDGDQNIISLRYIGPEVKAPEYSPEYTVRHVSEDQYAYGVLYTPVMDDSVVYNEMQRQHYGSHTLLGCTPIGDGHYGWAAIHTNTVVQADRHKPGDSLGSGFFGLSRLFGFAERELFLAVMMERHTTTIAILVGQNVVCHHVVPVGTSTLIRTISDQLGCPLSMARNILETHGLLDAHHDSRLRVQLLLVLAPIQNAIDNVIHQCIRDPYRPAYVRGGLASWVMGGAGARIPGISGVVGLGIDVDACTELAAPYRRLVIQMPQGPDKSALSQYYTALGLAIAGA